ncbi:MAG TPA: LytR C-terminal domain-containing protein [Gaiellaceae bacterium]|nr:LytR C-terminal domain-containing protein [Gaiellaceae bacterium]
MDHYLPGYSARPEIDWRRAALAVTAVAALELLLLVGLGIAYLGRGWFHNARSVHARTPAAGATRHAPAAGAGRVRAVTAARRVDTHPLQPRARTPLLVLNGNGRPGAAGAEAQVARAHGYPVGHVGNAKRSDYARSVVMYVPGFGREARRLARDLHLSVVTPLDGLTTGQLGRAKLAVVVGAHA